MTTNWFVLTRAVHFGSCLLFFGVLAFDRLVAIPSLTQKGQTEACIRWELWLRKFGLILLPTILLSGFGWFELVSMTMGGLPFQQVLQAETLKTVWTQTEFGIVWKWRLIFWLAASAGFYSFPRLSGSWRIKFAWMNLLASGLMLGSLAWAGHGLEGSGWHWLADVLHLLVAGLWPAGLLPFALLLHQLRQGSDPERWNSIAALVRRFSALSLAAVALLVLTGFVNSWFLVGSLANLFREAYGRWLVIKIILFCLAITIGAVNLFRLKPRLMAETPPRRKAEIVAAQLQLNVEIELALAMAIVIVVSILGLLPPVHLH